MAGAPLDPSTPPRPAPPRCDETKAVATVPLIALAWGRSGDKGNKANVGIIARRPEFMPWIWRALDRAAISQVFEHFLESGNEDAVERHYLPGINAMNIVLHEVLGGGGVASLRIDPQGKGYAQILLATPIPVPDDIAGAVT